MLFFLEMNPPTVTHQEKRVAVRGGRPVIYEDDRLKDARAKLTAHLMRDKPQAPMRGALQLRVQWLFPDESGRHKHGELRTTKPDTDNMQKLLKDCMTNVGYWQDDAQVAVEHVVKRWVRHHPGIMIEITSAAETEQV